MLSKSVCVFFFTDWKYDMWDLRTNKLVLIRKRGRGVEKLLLCCVW